MKENNKSKFAMNIFHQARKQIDLIAGLLGQSADKQWTQIYDLVWIAYSASLRVELPLMENKLADGLVIFLIVPN